MKRKSSAKAEKPKTKKPRIEVPDYHASTQVTGKDGKVIWPAPLLEIEGARQFILDCVTARKSTIIIPDKDADGLTSGTILRRTLILLGLPRDLISVHLLSKANNLLTQSEREAIAVKKPEYIFVLDHGSVAGPPIIDGNHRSMIIDHHYATSTDFPEDSLHVNACNCPPVVTSSLLTYLICEPLHPDVEEQCDWLAVIGTHGDLGTTLKWEAPFPDMSKTFTKYSKKYLNEAVSSLNAPRRTATFDVITAWDALIKASDEPDTTSGLKTLVNNPRLQDARREIAQETERCTHTPPKFSYDTRVAVLRITSKCQVHPVIATRWAGTLQSKKLEVVLVANDGYTEGMVHFSCRIAKCARARDPPVNIIELLNEYAAQDETGDLRRRLGTSFARGHKEASGGIVPKEEFEELLRVMRVGEKPEKTGQESQKSTPKKATQSNTLMNYFGKPK